MSLLETVTPETPATPPSGTPPPTGTTPPASTPPPGTTPPSEKLYAGKYKTPEELEKGYNNAVSEWNKAKEAIPKAPEKYNTDYSKHEILGKELKADDPLLNKLGPIFKEHNLSQSQVDGIIGGFFKEIRGIMPAYDPQAEIKKLGDSSHEVLNKLASSALDKNIAGNESEQKIFKSWCSSADECNYMIKLLGLKGSKNIPGNETSSSGSSSQSVAEAKQAWTDYREKHNNRIGADTEITKEYERLRRNYVELEMKVSKKS